MKTVIMCGGGGTRLWPLSRINLPKQFARLLEPQSHLSLFQHTILRNASFTDEFLIVVNKNQLHLAEQQIGELKSQDFLSSYFSLGKSLSNESININNVRFLVEPFGKNTAAVIAMSCTAFNENDDVLVVPSDHYLSGNQSYTETILKSKSYLQESKICLFGIQPTYPETGFGYIEFDQNKVLSFKEKPDSTTAQNYLQSGSYLWNGGIFAFNVKTMLAELNKHLSSTLKLAGQISISETVNYVPEDIMDKFENISIDYAVIEKSKELAILNATGWGWSDLGSFEALKNILNENLANDQKDNVSFPINPKVHNLNSENNFVISDKEVVLIDQKDLIVVDTGDALLISKAGSCSKVKEALPLLKNQDLTKNHLTVFRPWGNYTVLEDRSDYKVKSIKVNPGHRLSLQKHKFRAEIWTVVKGVAEVTIDDKTFDMKPNETCFIPLGAVHRLANKTNSIVEIVEIQTGESFDESDIIRLQDDYSRK